MTNSSPRAIHHSKHNKIAHIVLIPFRGVGVDNRNDTWFKERVQIFKNYTLKSLKAQTTKDFYVWLTFRQEDAGSKIVSEIQRALVAASMQYFITYNGLPYHDDKFGGSPLHKAKNIGRIFRQCWRNRNWDNFIESAKEVLYDKNQSLEARLRASLFYLDKLKGHGKVILTRIDSDDMFHREALKTIRYATAFDTQAITIPRGYIYNIGTDELAEYNPKTNPPFHSLVMDSEVFFDARKHIKFYRGYRSHEDVTRLFKKYKLPERFFCVVTHKPKNHISTTFNHPFKGATVDRNILKQFGI